MKKIHITQTAPTSLVIKLATDLAFQELGSVLARLPAGGQYGTRP